MISLNFLLSLVLFLSSGYINAEIECKKTESTTKNKLYDYFLSKDVENARAYLKACPLAQKVAATDLVFEASRGNASKVKFYLDSGVALNQKIDDLTALDWAVHNGFVPVVKLLLEKGADPKSSLNRAKLRLNVTSQIYSGPDKAKKIQDYNEILQLLNQAINKHG